MPARARVWLRTNIGRRLILDERGQSARVNRPNAEYRDPTDAEWAEFEQHPVDCTTSRSVRTRVSACRARSGVFDRRSSGRCPRPSSHRPPMRPPDPPRRSAHPAPTTGPPTTPRGPHPPARPPRSVLTKPTRPQPTPEPATRGDFRALGLPIP